MISLIAAVDKNWLIGDGNKLPWDIPEDLAYFKKITSGHAIVMGRKTFESIGRPLPNRINIILTKDANYQADGCKIIHNINEAYLFTENETEIFIIGGANVYEQFLSIANRIYLTKIDGEFKGDVYFPESDMSKWNLFSEEKIASKTGVNIIFQVYIKN